MNCPHVSQERSKMSDEYISPRLMFLVTHPHVIWSKFTEILYQVLLSNSKKNTKCRFHTKMEKVHSPEPYVNI